VLALVVGIHYLLAAVVSFVAATAFNYVLSIAHVFESGARFRKRHEIALVFVVSAVGLAINQAVLFALVQWTGVHLMVSKVAATGVVFLWNYFARSRYVFRAPGTVTESRSVRAVD
jgi:putative flippase GtrA